MPRNPVVDEFMTSLNHPYKAELEKLREIILGANSKIEEDIKWKCPTFVYNGNMASIVVRTKSHVQLMFHMYNMRHVQEHAAQLNLILGQKIASAPGWVTRAKSRR